MKLKQVGACQFGGKMKNNFRSFWAFVMTCCLVVGGAVSANAELTNSQTTSDSSTDSGGSYATEIDELQITGDSENSDAVYVYLGFKYIVDADDFANGSFAVISIDLDLDNEADFGIPTSNEIYDDGYAHKLDIYSYSTQTFVEGCFAETWTDLSGEADWIGFSIDKRCVAFGKQFGVSAYASDSLNDNTTEYDLIPNSGFFRVKTPGSTANTYNPGNTVDVSDIYPDANSSKIYSTSTPGSMPKNLVKLAAGVSRSVVTIYCGSGSGTGWAADVKITSRISTAGFRAFLITNHHVIEDCVDTSISIVLPDGSKATGYVGPYSVENDLAGIFTYAKIPALRWRGQEPAQGWWAATIGSPLGESGVLSTGIVSRVQTSIGLLNTTASIRPGNSGGPVFDRDGRVLGVASAYYEDVESLGVVIGAPMICKELVDCGNSAKAWVKSLPKINVKKYNSCTALRKDHSGGISKEISSRNKGATITLQPLVNSAIYDRNKKLDKDKDGLVCER